MSKLRQSLLDARKNAGLTQQMLADRVNIDRSSYTHIERGSRNPSIALALSIANELETTVEEIFLSANVTKKHDEVKAQATG